MRMVRTPEGTIRRDAGPHRAAGRGAYLCGAARCLRKAAPALARALRGTVSAELAEEMQQMAEHAGE